MHTFPFRLAIATLFLALGFASARGADSARTVLLSSVGATEQIHGVQELSLITVKGKGHPCTPKLGDTIELLVMDLDLWIDEMRKEGHITIKRDKELLAARVAGKPQTKEEAEAEKAYAAKDHGRELIEELLPRMVLILDGKAMTSLRTVAPSEDPDYIADPEIAPKVKPTAHDEQTKGDVARTESAPQLKRAEGRWFSVQFQLARDRDSEESKADWKDILRRTGVHVPMDVTLGITGDDGGTIYGSPTYVTKGANDPKQVFSFRRVPWDEWTATGIVLILGAFVLFVILALRTPILRDPSQPIRPDGLSPVSLGRCQMAFWLFLVAGAFVFLWLVTGRGDLDTITDSTLVLLGISAGTALGAAFVPGKDGSGAKVTVVNYREDIAAAKDRLAMLKSDRAIYAGKPDSAALMKANDDDMEAASAALRKGEENMAAFRRANPHQFLTDLLSEDGKTVTFHRFQIVVWTAVLGVVFVSEVLTRLAMPAFSSTLLLLMGISSGTYIGFKFTPNKPGATT